MTLADGTPIRLRRGWRRVVYRGRHRARGRVGHLASGLALYSALYLR